MENVNMLNLNGWMAAFNTVGNVDLEVGPWPDETGWSMKYVSSLGNCDADRRPKNEDEGMRMMMLGLMELILVYDLDPCLVHREFKKIEGYRDIVSPGVAMADKAGRLPYPRQ